MHFSKGFPLPVWSLWQSEALPDKDQLLILSMLTVGCTPGLEQTIDQFFKLNLPMRLPQLKGLTSGFDNALQHYTNKVVAQLGIVSFPITDHLVVIADERSVLEYFKSRETLIPRLSEA